MELERFNCKIIYFSQGVTEFKMKLAISPYSYKILKYGQQGQMLHKLTVI